MSPQKHRWSSSKKVLTTLKQLKSEGISLNAKSLIDHGYSSLLGAMSRYFGSSEAALRAAGLDAKAEWRGKRERYSVEEVVRKILRRKARGEKLTQQAITKADRLLLYSAEEHFGDWKGALEASGIDSVTVTYGAWTREGVRGAIRALKVEGVFLTHGYIAHHYPSLEGAVRRHYPSFQEAILDAGLDPSAELDHGPIRTHWSREKILQDLRRLKEKGESISVTDLLLRHKKLHQAIVRHYGSWTSAVEAAGFDAVKEARRPKSLKRKGQMS